MGSSEDLVAAQAIDRSLIYQYRDTEYRPMELDFIAQTMRYWFGGSGVASAMWPTFPESYLVVDVETSGFDPALDVLVDVGWCLVRNRQIVDRGGTVLNWYQHPIINWQWLCSRLDNCRANMAKKGKVYQYSGERLFTGEPADTVLNDFAGLLADVLTRGQLIVGHNAWFFERRLIDASLHKFLGRRLPWHENAIFDTGLIEKASQQNRMPWAGDTLSSWYKRCQAPPLNVKWSLDEHCVPKYRLERRYGFDLSKLHTAEEDAVVSHYLFETYRDIAEGTYQDGV